MILKKYVHYVSCHLEGRVVSLIATTPGGMGKYLHIIVEEIVQSVERIMGYCCQVGVSRSVNTLGKCRESYLEAMNALSYSRRIKAVSISFPMQSTDRDWNREKYRKLQQRWRIFTWWNGRGSGDLSG